MDVKFVNFSNIPAPLDSDDDNKDDEGNMIWLFFGEYKVYMC